jgi:hypothetical protein
MPILPGKMEKWQAMMDHVKSTPEFSESSEAVGVHERTFVQRTPAGDLLIITLEGDDPAASWTKIMATMPPDFAVARHVRTFVWRHLGLRCFAVA